MIKATMELDRIATLSAFNINGYIKKRKVNQHAEYYYFEDSSILVILITRKAGLVIYNGFKVIMASLFQHGYNMGVV
tara:strand:- start:969 stop:1199 length:231 start_codon:yes stop_codon:yes gene_type:complete